jgi:DnaJ-class molecular chaperone
MPEHKDYYQTLGVPQDVSQEDLKRAYRKLARQCHPDVNPGDKESEERFKAISEAYHVLSDKERREAYDRGPESFAEEFDLSDFFSHFSRATGGRGGGGRVHFADLNDLFGGVFSGAGGAGFGTQAGQGAGFGAGGFGTPWGQGQGFPGSGPGGPGGRGPKTGRDVNVPLSLSFDDALNGVERSVTFRRPALCDACGGAGSQGGVPCGRCGGSGQIQKTDRAKVRIPAGVSDGAKVRVPGRGEPGLAGGPAGDLYLTITVEPHDVFRREGSDLYAEVPVTIYEAGLGATIHVPTLAGSARINLPAGTRAGQVIRIAGKGAPIGNQGETSANGDLYVTVRIDMPEVIDSEAEELLRKFAKEHPYNPRFED